MKVLFDTDVVFDLLLDRRPHAEAAGRLLSRVESGEISGYLCATAVTSIHNLAVYPYNPNDGRKTPPVSYSECCRVLRGGSCLDSDDYLRSAGRYDGGNPNGRYYNIGFRCVKTG